MRHLAAWPARGPNGPICIGDKLFARLRRMPAWPSTDGLFAREGRLPWRPDDTRTVMLLIRLGLRAEAEAKAKE